MKSILLSIKPKYVELIANGSKTIEVRKNRPKIETPYKCYIYETKRKQVEKLDGCEITYYGRGRVIGSFNCDRIDSYVGRYENKDYWDLSVKEWEELKKKSCLTIPQILEYTGDCPRCYGWHISDLKIYDKPRDLSEFKTVEKLYRVRKNTIGLKGGVPLTRPFQSWGYCESLGE